MLAIAWLTKAVLNQNSSSHIQQSYTTTDGSPGVKLFVIICICMNACAGIACCRLHAHQRLSCHFPFATNNFPICHYGEIEGLVWAHKLPRNIVLKGKNWIVVEINQIESLRECVRRSCFSGALVHSGHYWTLLFSYFWRISDAFHWSRGHRLGTQSHLKVGGWH